MSKENTSKNEIEEVKRKECRVKKFRKALDDIDNAQKTEDFSKDWDKDPKKIAKTTQKNLLRAICNKIKELFN